MNRIHKLAVIVCVGISGFSISNASVPTLNDTTIRILVVGDLLVLDPTLIDEQLDFLETAWTSSPGLNTPISITIANSGIPVEYTDDGNGKICCTQEESLDEIEEFVSESTVVIGGGDPVALRDVHGADLVLGFSQGFLDEGICGQVRKSPWVSPIIPPYAPPSLILNPLTFGLDLRGANSSYVGVISLDDGFVTECDDAPWTAAHEFGHLLGGGHWETPPPPDIFNPFPLHYLYSDSRSDRSVLINEFRFWPPPTYTIFQSAVGTGGDDGCVFFNEFYGMNMEVTSCTNFPYFSGALVLPGTPGHDNARTFDDTAESVANFRRGEPLISVDTCSDGIDNDGDGNDDLNDPDCTGTSVSESSPPPPIPPNCDYSSKPYNVEGTLIQECAIINGVSWTPHRIRWAHSCPGQVDHYEIEFSQPDGDPYVFGWNVFSTSTDSLVIGSPSRVRIRACSGVSCSAPSNTTFLAIPTC